MMESLRPTDHSEWGRTPQREASPRDVFSEHGSHRCSFNEELLIMKTLAIARELEKQWKLIVEPLLEFTNSNK